MSTPFLSEIKIWSCNYAPKGWAFCDGALLSIQQNAALFSLLGTNYGGDGIRTFGLPNLQGRVPMHVGQGFALAGSGGEQAHTLTVAEIPGHNHPAYGTSTAGSSPIPDGNLLGAADGVYTPSANTTTLQPATIASNVGGQPHSNLQPYLALNFCIALQGVFPTQS